MDQKKEGLNGLENEEISSSDVAQSEELVQMDAAEATDKKPETPQSTIFVKHEYNTKKPVKNGGSKRILICVISLVLCIAIAGGVFLINRFLPNDEEGTSSSG
ncbi:MAG: hypothetical protein J6Q67_01420, partial [Clostridia bacterium]|nr:hypothetical protein [Clostridia bacterium]